MWKVVLLPMPEDIPLYRPLKLISIQDNSPSDLKKLTMQSISGINGVRRPSIYELASFFVRCEPHWKLLGYYSQSHIALCRAIKTFTASIYQPTIFKKFTEFRNDRIFDVTIKSYKKLLMNNSFIIQFCVHCRCFVFFRIEN